MSFKKTVSCPCKKNAWIVRQDSKDNGSIYCPYCDMTIHFTLEWIEYSV